MTETTSTFTFGIKASEVPEVESGGAGGSFIKYFKPGDTRLRYLEEIPDWTRYYEHFHQAKQRTFPCLGPENRDRCPGCTSPNPKTAVAAKKFLVNALDPETGYVDLYKIPASIKADFDRFVEKDHGTIILRDFTVVRGVDPESKRTKYSVDREDREERDLTGAYELMKDHQEALQAAYIEVWGGPPGQELEFDGEEPRGADKPQPHSGALKAAAARKSWSGDDNPPSKPQTQRNSGTGEKTTLTEGHMRRMTVEELRVLYITMGLEDPGKDSTPDQLVDGLIEALA